MGKSYLSENPLIARYRNLQLRNAAWWPPEIWLPYDSLMTADHWLIIAILDNCLVNIWWLSNICLIIILCLSVVQQNMRVTSWIVSPLLTKALYKFGCFKGIFQKAKLALLLFYWVTLTQFWNCLMPGVTQRLPRHHHLTNMIATIVWVYQSASA